MSKLDERILLMLTNAKNQVEEGTTIEENLGIKICTSEEDHVFVTTNKNQKNYRTYTMKPLNLKQVIDFSLETEEVEQTCLICGKKQALVKKIKIRK